MAAAPPMATRPRLSELTSEQLLQRAEEYRALAAGASTTEVRNALNRLAGQFEALAARRVDALAAGRVASAWRDPTPMPI